MTTDIRPTTDTPIQTTAEFVARETQAGYAVHRSRDNAYAEFLDSAERDAALAALRDGDASEDDYVWVETNE